MAEVSKSHYGFIDLGEMEDDLPKPKPTGKVELHTFKPGELKKTPQEYGIDGPVLVEKRFEMVCDDENFSTKKGVTEHNKYSTAILFEDEDGGFGTAKITGKIGRNAIRQKSAEKNFATHGSAEDYLDGEIIKKITKSRSGCTYPSKPAKKYIFSAEDPNPNLLAKSFPYIFAAGLGVLGYWAYLRLRSRSTPQQYGFR